MMKTITKLKITISALCILLFAICTFSAFGAVPARAEQAPPTEATDVYWYVQSGKLLLSASQGSSGYYKWNKEDIAAVNNESDVPWNSSRASIESVIIYETIAPPSTAFWFRDTNLTSFSTSALDMRFVTDMSRMFAGCSALSELDLSGVSAPLVENIESAFDGCSSLKSLDISYLDGAPISNMMNAFYGCSKLTELDVSGLDISRVTDFTGVFGGCAALKALDLSGLDGRKLTTLADTFNGCSSLTSLTFGDEFTCENVTDMKNTFKTCKSLTTLDISGFSTSKVTDMSGVFSYCELLEELILGEGFVCSDVTNMEAAFLSCKALKSVDTSAWDAVKVENMSRLFTGCTSLETVDLSGFDGASPTDISSMFSNAASLKHVDLSGLNTESVTSLLNLFNGCTALLEFDLSSINTSAVTRMEGLFQNCTALTSFSFVGVNTSNVETMDSMFYGCTSLKSVDLSGLNTERVTSLSNLFNGCTALLEFDLSSINTSAVTRMEGLFKNCTALTSFSFVGVNTSNVETMNSMFYGCTSLKSVDLTGIDSGKVTDIGSMFYACYNLKRLDLSDFDIVEGIWASFVFKNCYSLEMIYAPESIPESVSISLTPFAFYTGEGEITELTSDNQGKSVVRKFDIKYFWKNGTQKNPYTFEPSYYYYGYGATVTATLSENGYVFEGWMRADSDLAVTKITETDTGDVSLYAKMTAYQPVAPVITESDDVTVTYGEGFEVKIDFAEEPGHTYRIDWYRTLSRNNTSGFEVTEIRNTRGFTIDPKWFKYGIEIETETYFYCTVTAKRTDNGLTKTARSEAIKVYVERAQAEITVHPEAFTGLVYNGSAQQVATYGESTFGEVYYSIYESEGYTTGGIKQKNAGTAILYYRVPENKNYKGTETYQLEYTIEAATPTVSWDAESVAVNYTGEAALIDQPSVLLLGSDTYNGAFSYSYTGTSSGEGLPVNAGTYSVIASIAAGGNYKAASSEALTLVINKAEAKFNEAPSPISGLIYSGSEQALVNRGDPIGGTVEFSFDEESWSSDLPKGKNAGEYTVYYRIKGDNNCFDGASGSLAISIGKKNITVTAEDMTVCVNHTYTLTYKVDGLAVGDALPMGITLNTEANVETVGDYVITVSGEEENDNYTVTYVGGTLSVRNHAYNDGEITTAPTCSAVGKKTYTCAHNSAHTYTEDVAIDENAHAWSTGVVTVEPTCSAVGTKTFVCAHNSAHTYTEVVAIDENAHAWSAGVVTAEPTCSAVGTKTFVCAHNSTHTYTEVVAIDENAHAWSAGVVTVEPTCSAVGTKTFVCAHNSAHTYTEDIDALGHKYDNDCDGDCNVCAEARTPAEHPDADEDQVCDVCGARIPKDGLSGGAIAGIAVGSAAVSGVGGFSVFWFVIKKKKLIDLIGIFKK